MLPTQVDIAIVGAGPQSLTLATFLLQKRRSMRHRFMVFDPSGTWMSRWQYQFAALEIPHLRSPAVHHPDPNPFALRAFAEGRSHELHSPYDLPGTKLFQDFCQEVIQRWELDDRVCAAQVVRVEPMPQSRFPFRLWLQDGQTILARRVVVANGGSGVHCPAWVDAIPTPYPDDRLLHSTHIDLRQLHLQGERILIIGGGLTSGHLAVGAASRGAQVLLMARRQIHEKLFDADPGWLGPKYLKDFWAEPNWMTRWQMIQAARNGGSMTPAMVTRLRRLERTGQITIYEQCQVAQAVWQGTHWRICCNQQAVHHCIHPLPIDRIWLSTGSTLDVTEQSLLAEVLATYPTSIVNGLPVLDEHLRWQGCELFMMGGLAALQVGPTARNLSGGRMASERIVPALTKPSLARS
ncbi:FAD-dependent oxidoreductase [filamentous cyanobacterium CCP1]|nr:FAD-dependent oxidoreductase [filamentous cyanobacterium CCP2]PSB67901.1 FAD-dependent oxidoreductase [filamentous cyanobacterium CCP1]